MDNLQYWQERQAKLLHSIYNEQEVNTVKFLKEYKTALNDLQIVTDELFRKYSTGGELSMTEIYKYDRYTKMLDNIKEIVKSLGGKEKNFVQTSLTDNYVNACKGTGDIITKIGGNTIKIDFSIVPKEQIERSINYPWSGADYSSRIWDNKNKLIKNLSETVTQGIVQGKSNTDMARDLKDRMDKGAYECRRLVRTETQHILVSASVDTYKKAGLEKLQFYAAEDERTCDECGELHEQIFDFDDAPICPIHCSCRCVLLPVID